VATSPFGPPFLGAQSCQTRRRQIRVDADVPGA
jgi:hypothetical protein